MKNDFLDKNLLCLSQTSPEAAHLISRSNDSPHVHFITARDGSLVPVLSNSGSDKPLHSRFNPIKEGRRFSSSQNTAGTILAYGLGGAYHLLPLLEHQNLVSLLIIDTEPEIIRSILREMDLSSLFLDKRVSIWISRNAEDFKPFLLSRYIPVLSGDLQSVSLRPRVDNSSDFFHRVADVVKESISTITDDYTVQTHFGKKWFVNTLTNLKASEETTLTLNPVKKVQITAAGPSLEKQIDHLLQYRDESTLIATDTSLPVLLSHGIKPDMVISIDCQHISYHHFMQGYPEDIPLILDLASPPFLTRIAKKYFFFTSDHPFSNYVSRNFRSFPRIDTSGGNVTHAALSLAESLGAKQISLFGTDFSYPYGKPYSRGSYIFPYFQKQSSRMDGIESQFLSFVLHNQSLDRENFPGGFRYISKPMIHYKTCLENKANTMNAFIENIRGDGVHLDFVQNQKGISGDFRMMSAGIPFQSRADFLHYVSREINDFPVIDTSLIEFLSSLTHNQKGTLMSILPAAAHFRKNCSTGEEALNLARKWTLELLKRKAFYE
jgi:hypothetical protein